MSAPEEHTLTPQEAQRALGESRRSKRDTDTVVQRAAATFDKSRGIGERNGFTEGIKALLRGAA